MKVFAYELEMRVELHALDADESFLASADKGTGRARQTHRAQSLLGGGRYGEPVSIP
jgi:hypothetical protein